jgi:Tfp pilus assembly protein PilZ
MFRSQSLEPIDLSSGGVRVYTHFRLRAGERMKMELILPDTPTLSVVAEVVWVEVLAQEGSARSEVGLRFVGLDDAAKAAIARVLEPSASEAPVP